MKRRNRSCFPFILISLIYIVFVYCLYKHWLSQRQFYHLLLIMWLFLVYLYSVLLFYLHVKDEALDTIEIHLTMKEPLFTTIRGSNKTNPTLVVFHHCRSGFANNMVGVVTSFIFSVLLDGVMFCIGYCVFLIYSRAGLSIQWSTVYKQHEGKQNQPKKHDVS